MSDSNMYHSLEGIAVIGMSARFPGSNSVEEYWRSLRDGVESITRFSAEELISSGVDPLVLNAPNYVPARGVLDNIDLFDASFFGFSPREAEIMDPHHRLFLEQAWAALENAGYDAEDYRGIIGIYGGMGVSEYLIHNLLPNRDVVLAAGNLQLRILNDKDFLTSLVAYKLDLKGPSINVQTACSTSLVAVYLACQGLLSYQTDIALVGGVAVTVPPKGGYLSQKGVYSPDGHCRAFDAKAEGTVGGNGVGVVLLKRLADALEDNDTIHAVIKGAAINNDGALKVGYTAPSVDGQAEVIAMAQAAAGVRPETISYIEAHGTGTPLGDPIEIAALTQVFRADTQKKGFCAIGSVKTNIGHTDASAGVASLIKTILALKHRQLPPSLHFTVPNPQIDFASSPFYVNDKLAEWKSDAAPRRAGVSAFAIGGVNAHVIVEEAPVEVAYGPFRRWHLLVLSAKTESALEAASDNLVAHLKQNPALDIADVAYTLHIGRHAFECRRMVVCNSLEDAIAALETRHPKRVFDDFGVVDERPVAFMFPGLGNHYVDMGAELYREEPVFREHLDRCCEMLKPHLKLDLRDIIYPAWRVAQQPNTDSAAPPLTGSSRLDFGKMLGRDEPEDEATRRLNQTRYTQPALFVIEYALAQLWMKWGVQPTAMIGYSIGEYVAACLAGVFSLEDALMLVAARAQMIQELPPGAMLAVTLSEQELLPLMDAQLSLAAINGPSLCVVSGPPDDIAALERQLAEKGVAHRRLQTTHAFHSRMMEPVVGSLTELLGRVKLNPPQLPFISNVSGTWITTAQATDPHYWATHLSRPVRYGDGIAELWKESDTILLEVGPGQALGAWALQHPASESVEGRLVLASLRHSYERQPDVAFLLGSQGKLWLAGAPLDRQEFYEHRKRHRIPLPTYPFERQRFWIQPPKPAHVSAPAARADSLEKTDEAADWFYLPAWKQGAPLEELAPRAWIESRRNWLLFGDECGVGARLAEALEREMQDVTVVKAGEGFGRLDGRTFTINPAREEDYDALLAELRAQSKLPHAIVHLWGVTPEEQTQAGDRSSATYQETGFFSLLNLAKALGNQSITDELRIAVVTSGVRAINGAERLEPEKATVLGPCRVIPQEYPNFKCLTVDITVPAAGNWQEEKLTEYLMSELAAEGEQAVAYRGQSRWVQTFEPFPLERADAAKGRLREGGVYLITGGLGGIGLVLAEYLARTVKAKLVLTGRTALPARQEWGLWLAAHDAHEPLSEKIRKVRELEASGAEVLCCRADVTERRDMEQVIREADERFGRIDGVIHAAGVQPGGMIQVKTAAAAASVLAPKVRGTLVLDELCRGRKLDFFILCSSLNALMGSFGLVDHCAANAFLDALAHQQHAENRTHMLSINWDAWLEVGQAANPTVSGGLRHILEAAVERDVQHPLLDKCVVEEADREIYVTELSMAKHWVVNEHRISGSGVIPGTAYLEMVRAAFERRAAGRHILIRNVLFAKPLLVQDGETKEVRTIIGRQGDRFDFNITSRLDAPDGGETRWLEHVTGEVAIDGDEPPRRHDLEELKRRCQEAVISFTSDEPNGHHDEASFLRAGDFKSLPDLVAKVRDAADPLSRYIREQLSIETRQLLDEQRGVGVLEQKLLTRLLAELNGLLRRESVYDEGRFAHVELSAETRRLIKPNASLKDTLRLNRLLMEEAYPAELTQSLRARHLDLGPRWESLLKRLYVGKNEGLALIELPEEFASDLDEFHLHPSLMDVATGFAQSIGEGFYLPMAYTKLIVKRPLSRRIYSHVKYRDGLTTEKETIACDIVIMDEQGTELVLIEEFILRRIREVAVFEGPPEETSRGTLDDLPMPVALGETHTEDAGAQEDEGPLRVMEQGQHVGLTPPEGAEAFARILAMAVRVPQIAVSVRNLPALIEQVRTHTKAEILEKIGELQSRRARHPRPHIQTTYVAPANDLQKRLVGIWEEMLGLEQVGIYDNFFDIGGDSLLATQLIARVGEAFQFEMSLRTLFEAPTIAEFNVAILQKQAEQTDTDTLAQLLAKVKSMSGEELETMLVAKKPADDD